MKIFISNFAISVIILLFCGTPTLEAQSRNAQEFDIYGCIRNAETPEMIEQCGSDHIEYWRERMAHTFNQLSRLVKDVRKEMLENSQEAWNEYRLRETELSNTIHFSSPDPANRILARIREARIFQQRAEFLEDLILIEQEN
ncbi:MAG: lysozyme inhibitor LprI family protein [Balneolales bacterium]|nr:lysozyme inhibitor LprI family protein [Balneolales bacterium]